MNIDKFRVRVIKQVVVIVLAIVSLWCSGRMLAQAGISLDEDLSFRETFELVGSDLWTIVFAQIGIVVTSIFPDVKKIVDNGIV